MKLINKTKTLLMDRSGETIVEVVVAFAVLSIMMVMFAQGISYASRTGVRAGQTREEADKALISLRDDTSEPAKVIVGSNGVYVYRQVYTETVDGNSYTFVVYSPDPD